MTNSKTTKRAFASSALAVFLCVVMLIGTTFAWFTDTASTSVNKIQAGNLDVDLQVATEYDLVKNDDGTFTFIEIDEWKSAEGMTLNFIHPEGHEDEPILWEPGCTHRLAPLRVVNNGNLALKFVVSVTGIKGDAKLNEAIDWTVSTPNDIITLQPGAMSTFTVKGHMKEDAGNEYQGLSIDGIGITVYATQATSEYDSFDNQYDENAPLPSVWDGTTVTELTLNTTDNKYHITNAAQFAGFVSGDRNYFIPAGSTVVLDCDVDLGGRTVKGYANGVFDSDFDGQGHTVSNFTVTTTYSDGEHYCGLFPYVYGGCSVKNLTVKDAKAIAPDGVGMVGLITGAAYNGSTIENCHAINCVAIGEKKVAAVVGSVDAGTVTNCSATNCTVYCGVSETETSGSISHLAGEVVGFEYGGATVTDCTFENVTVTFGVTSHVGGDVNITAGEKVGYVANATVTVENGEGNFHRIYSDNATFVNCVFEGEGNHWIGDAATFINCTFDVVIDNAEPKTGTITFENCTFNKNVHFASADGTDTSTDKFFEAKNCRFNANLTVSNFEKVSLTNCAFSGSNWAGKNMISYSPLVIDNCTFTTGIRLSYSDTTKVTCTNGTVDLSWSGGSATVGSST